MEESLQLQIAKISKEYFVYIARSYPVMCLSDEFYFFPRAKKAIEFLNSLDSLDKDKIKQDISCIKNLKSSLEALDSKEIKLETKIDLMLLNQSMSTFLREFDQVKIWQLDPNLYLKISLLGISQIITRFSSIKPGIDDYLRDRIAKVPRLLREAEGNLKQIPSAYLEVAIEMIDASTDYLKKLILPEAVKNLNKKTLEALQGFKRFLIKQPSRTAFIKDREFLEDILKNSFSYKRDLEEIFDIAFEEYRRTLKDLEKIKEKVEPRKTWQQILSTYKIEAEDPKELLKLYSSEIEKVQAFIREKEFFTIPQTQKILVQFTPQFMKPIRASASYSSPVTDDEREPAYFYVTADFVKPGPISAVHNEYIFVTAHETYPGHHLLDSVRRGMANPIRQQIESPLFYEGWASYAERIIDEFGYIKDPVQKMLGLKRQAWRAVRAMLDVGIRINRLKFEDAEELLKNLGYTARIAKFMFRHYALSPGYQLCYTMGKFEIDRLRERFSSRLGLKGFHDLILEGGQIPFDLIEKRIENKLCQENS